METAYVDTIWKKGTLGAVGEQQWPLQRQVDFAQSLATILMHAKLYNGSLKVAQRALDMENSLGLDGRPLKVAQIQYFIANINHLVCIIRLYVQIN